MPAIKNNKHQGVTERLASFFILASARRRRMALSFGLAQKKQT